MVRLRYQCLIAKIIIATNQIEEALKNTPFYRDDGINFINAARLQQSNNSEIINLRFSKPVRKIYPMTTKNFFLSDI